MNDVDTMMDYQGPHSTNIRNSTVLLFDYFGQILEHKSREVEWQINLKHQDETACLGPWRRNLAQMRKLSEQANLYQLISGWKTLETRKDS